MFKEDKACVDNLLKPVKRILTQENSINKESTDKRMQLWNEVRENYNKYIDGDCGKFLKDMDNVFHSQFNAALLVLAITFEENGEIFESAHIFSDKEIEVYKKIAKYNVFDIYTPSDIRKKLEVNDNEVLLLLSDYYFVMEKWVNSTLNDSSMNLWVRFYLKKKWGDYRRTIDDAIRQDLDRWMHLISKYHEQQLNDARIKIAEVESAAEQSKGEITRKTEKFEVERKEHEESVRKYQEEKQIFEDQKDDLARVKVTLGMKEKEIHDQQKEFQKKEQELNEKVTEIERIRQKWNKVQESSSRFVSLGDVKQYEMNFIGRSELKIGALGKQIIIIGKTFKVEKITEDKESHSDILTSRIKCQLTETEIRNLPENRYLTIKLIEKKLLGTRQRYTFRALFLSRPSIYAEFGFDTEPLTVNDINPVLVDACNEAKSIGEPIFLCIASPTGFVPDIHTFMDSDDFHKNFLSKYLSVCFLDLETAKTIINPADEVGKSFLPYCEMELDREKMEKVRRVLYRAIDDQFQIENFAEYNKALLCCKEAGLLNDVYAKSAFYQYGDEKGMKVRPIKGVGLVMMR